MAATFFNRAQVNEFYWVSLAREEFFVKKSPQWKLQAFNQKQLRRFLPSLMIACHKKI
jgi:hypothetical protein